MRLKSNNKELNSDWVSMAEGSRNLGFSRSYLDTRIRKDSLENEMLEKGMLLKLGNAKFINSKGIEFVKKHVKKLGVRTNRKIDCVDVYLKLAPLSTLYPA